MSNSTLVNLATVGSDELQAMPVGVFTANLEQMSAEAIVRFRRMRKLSAKHRSALEQYLAEHPDKRPGGDAPAAESSGRADKKSENGKQKKRKGSSEASLAMDLLLRVMAWWEGMATDDLAKAKGIKRYRRRKKTAAPPAPKEPKALVQSPAAKSVETPPVPPLSRIELIQKLWGDGFSLPGGAEFALRIAAPVNFKANGRYLDLAPGLGGGMRAVASACHTTISGIETDAELAAMAYSISEAAGMAKTAPVRPLGPDGLGPEDFEPAGSHDAIFMREAMFAVEERQRMLAEIWRGLRDDGSLVLTDYVLADGVGSEIGKSGAVASWEADEAGGGSLWTEAEYREMLAAQDYKLDRFEDLTSAYLPFVHAGLRHFHDCLQNAKFPPETATTLIREGSVWLARSQALESGQLRLVHIHARRQPSAGRSGTNEADRALDEVASLDE